MLKFALFINFFCFALFYAAGISHAQNKIIVINKDGTREEVLLNQDTPAKPKVEAPKVQTEGQPQPSASDLIQPSAPPQTETVEQVPEPEKTVPKPAAKAVPPKKQVQSKPKNTELTPKPKQIKLPYPKPKPSEAEIVKAKAAKPRFNYIDPNNIPEGTPITEDLATRVALEVAPPSRGFQVFVTEYEGVPAYQVRFKTENGPHDVIVDGATGQVLKK
jgi:uncharacterized membrane protein YkoI